MERLRERAPVQIPEPGKAVKERFAELLEDGELERGPAYMAAVFEVGEQYLEAKATIGDDVDAWLDSAFWGYEDEALLALLLGLLSSGALDAVALTAAELEAIGFGVDWTLANADAVAWAGQYAGELVVGINQTTRDALKRSVSNWLNTPGSTIGDLTDDIADLYPFDQSRAHGIAVTETTRSYGEGHGIAYQEAGIPPRAYKEPAHPRGRCWMVARPLPNGDWVVIWMTNRDELVCKQPLYVPWGSGTAAGCLDLENRVVSEGPYLGMKFRDAQRVAREEN